MTNLAFNPAPPTVMHIDLNSCFATIEQQANPYLRGKPLVVAAYDAPGGCILASSIEAKKMGIKTGMRVKDGKKIYPGLLVLPPDPPKYRYVHLKLRKILNYYTNNFHPKSIDEFVLDLNGYPCLRRQAAYKSGMENIGLEIKKRIKKEAGEWLTVSIGISTNRFLAKTASNLKKPDGLEEINKNNFWEVYSRLKLTDLNGIAERNKLRLNIKGIYTVQDLYNSANLKLKTAFGGIWGYYWYLRLRGWEIDSVEFDRKSYGNSYALPQPFDKLKDLAPILCKLTTKTGERLRKGGYQTQGVSIYLVFRDGSFWHHGEKLARSIFDSRDIYREAYRVLSSCPNLRPVRNLAVSCFNLKKFDLSQLDLFSDINKQRRLIHAVDTLNKRWGEFVVAPGRMADTSKYVHDRIAFGGVKEL